MHTRFEGQSDSISIATSYFPHGDIMGSQKENRTPLPGWTTSGLVPQQTFFFFFQPKLEGNRQSILCNLFIDNFHFTLAAAV